MMVYSFAFLLVGLSCSFTLGKTDEPWDYLLFAQFWPPSSCIYLENHGDHCEIPTYVKDWTIHGLWPSIPYSEKPQSCNNSSPFDYDEIKSLGPQLDRFWHYYGESKGDPHYLWNHEWCKHGTCAYSLAAIRGEMNFFNKTLQLHSQVNLTAVLSNSGVEPSASKSYKREDFFNAVLKSLKVKPFIVCVYDKKTKQSFIDQIYLCYDKTFQRQDCYSLSKSKPFFFQDCSDNEVFYPPYDRKTAHLSNKSLIFHSEKNNH